MADRPTLSLTTKDFSTGLAQGAFDERGGLFLTTGGASTINSAGITGETDQGLFKAGDTGENVDDSAVLLDTIVSGERYANTAGTYDGFFYGDGGYVYKQTIPSDSGLSILNSGAAISNPAQGFQIFEPQSGDPYIYYWQRSQIGRYGPLDGSPAFTNNYITSGVNNTTVHPTHRQFDELYYGNLDSIGQIKDNGAGSVTHSGNVLDIPENMIVTAISDDSYYLAIAITDNKLFNANAIGDTRVIFWDRVSSSWLREYRVNDPCIRSMVSGVGRVIALGARGLYEVSFNGGVRQLSNKGNADGMGTSTPLFGYRLLTKYNDAFVHASTEGNNRVIDLWGRADTSLPVSRQRPFSTGATNEIGYVDLVSFNEIYVATTSDTLKKYRFGSNAVPRTSVSPQTRYISFPTRVSVERIDIVFGEPLASGDELNIDLKSDEDTAASDFGTASFATDGAVRRKSLYGSFQCENLSLVINFVGGAVKIKKIEIYTHEMTP